MLLLVVVGSWIYGFLGLKQSWWALILIRFSALIDVFLVTECAELDPQHTQIGANWLFGREQVSQSRVYMFSVIRTERHRRKLDFSYYCLEYTRMKVVSDFALSVFAESDTLAGVWEVLQPGLIYIQ